MKRIFSILTIAILCATLQCSDDKSTGPPDDDDDFTLIDSETVGSDGGTLASDGFHLTVPAGAFDSDHKLKLYVTDDDEPFGENTMSKGFRVEGVPEDFSLPLQITIEYTGTLSGESSIAVGEEYPEDVESPLRVIYGLIAATDSAGTLTGTLSPGFNSAGSPDHRRLRTAAGANFFGLWAIRMFAISNFEKTLSDDGHFIFRHSKSVDMAVLNELSGYFEEAIDVFSSKHFLFHGAVWPETVYVWSLGKVKDSIATFGKYTELRHCRFSFNRNAMKQEYLPWLKMCAGREVFRFLQDLYDPDFTLFRRAGQPLPENEWLHLASATWAQKLFTTDPDFIPIEVQGHVMLPFEGIQKGQDFDPVKHGYSMSSLILYLVEEYDSYFMVEVYDDFSGRKHPVKALFDNAPDPHYLWLVDYFSQYIEGRIYDDCSAFPIAKELCDPDNATAVFNIDSENDTVEVFASGYYDLSAQVYHINLNWSQISNDDKIYLSVDEADATILLFKKKGETLEFIELGYDLTVTDAGDLYQSGWDLLAVIVNSDYRAPDYRGSNNIDFTVRLRELLVIPWSSFTKCSIGVGVWGHVQNSAGESWYEDPYTRSLYGLGGFSGNIFNITGAVPTGASMTVEGSVIIDPAVPVVTSFELEVSVIDVYAGVQWHWSTNGINVPLYAVEPAFGMVEFRIDGGVVCNRVSSLTSRIEGIGDDTWQELTAYNCNENSYVYITFVQ